MGKMSTILRVSIALNIFLLGSIAGAGFWFADRQHIIMAGSLRVAGSELPLEQRKAFRSVLREGRRSMASQLAGAREARHQAAELLRQPEIDSQAIAAALDKARSADVAVRAEIESRALAFISTLPASERSLVADAIEQRGKLGRRAPD